MFLFTSLFFLMTGPTTDGWQISLEDQEVFIEAPVAVDDQGNIMVLSTENHSLVLLDPNGKHIRTFGKEGQGPGEFMQIEGIAWLADQNVFAVTDRKNQRVSWWSAEGELKAEQKAREMIRRPAFMGSESIFFLRNHSGRKGSEPEIMRFTMDRGKVKKFWKYKALESDSGRHKTVDGAQASVNMDWDPTMLYASGKDFLVAGFSGETRLSIIDIEGETVSSFDSEMPTVPLLDDHKEIIFENLGNYRDDIEPYATDPDHWPYYKNITIDDKDQIWLFSYASMPGKSVKYRVFNREGELQSEGTTKFPATQIKNGMMYATYVDAEGTVWLAKEPVPTK